MLASWLATCPQVSAQLLPWTMLQRSRSPAAAFGKGTITLIPAAERNQNLAIEVGFLDELLVAHVLDEVFPHGPVSISAVLDVARLRHHYVEVQAAEFIVKCTAESGNPRSSSLRLLRLVANAQRAVAEHVFRRATKSIIVGPNDVLPMWEEEIQKSIKIGPDYIRVVSTSAQDLEQIAENPHAKLRIVWDADSVPYTDAVLLALLGEAGDAQVQSVDVFTSSATVAALCHPPIIAGRPTGGAAHTCASGTTGAEQLHTHLLRTLQTHNTRKNTFYIVVSDDAAVRESLIALGPRAAAVTTTMAVPDLTPGSSASAPPPVPKGTPWVHLALESSCPPQISAPAGPSEAVHTDPESASSAKRARFARKRAASGHVAVAEYPRPDAKGAAAALLAALRQPQKVQCAVLSRCLARVSEGHFDALRQCVLGCPPGFYDSDDFPDEILRARSLRDAVVVGFGKNSTWLACEKAAVLDVILKFGAPGLFAQIGLLALEPAHGKLPSSCTSELALAVAKDQVYLAYGMSFAMQFRDGLRLAPDADATSANVPAAVKSKTAIKSAVAPPDDADWRRLVKLLRLVSEDWFTEARRLINSKRRLCSKIAHFPAALRSGGSLDFADRVLAMLGSAAVPLPEKQAFVRAVLKFNHAVLFAELGFAWAGGKRRVPDQREAREAIYADKDRQHDGRRLLESFLIEE